MKNPIFVALDLDDMDKAILLAENLKGIVGGYKLGPRLVYKYGAELVQKLSRLGPVFIDNKYYDIPNTMEFSVRSTFEAGASYATIHASCGPEALKRMAELEKELSQVRDFKILVVTVLTSFSQASLPANWLQQDIGKHVMSLAKQAYNSGLKSFVCSSAEIKILKEEFNDCFLVVPGIRRPQDQPGDQVRTMDPKTAIALGADALVVGRPIYQATSPVQSAKDFLQAL